METVYQPAYGCLLCGDELIYTAEKRLFSCELCGVEHGSEVACVRGHYVCDPCHAQPAMDLIEKTCLTSGEIDPIRLTERLMTHPAIKLHGPEHHYLVAAVLIATCCSSREDADKETLLKVARKRADDVKGGFCGTHGTCGAAMGAGIAASVLFGATPLAKQEWRLANLLTGACLTAIGNAGGPRCCKRDSYLALLIGRDFFNEHLKSGLPQGDPPSCSFADHNKECLRAACPFFPGPTR